MTKRHTILLWFRNDLRLADNAIFNPKIIKNATHCVPVVCLEQRHPQAEKARQFRHESIADLRHSFKEKFDLPVYISNKSPTDLLPYLVRKIGGEGTIISSTEVCTEELEDYNGIAASIPDSWTLKSFWNYSLYHIDDLPFVISDLPQPFTSMRKILEDKRCLIPIRNLLPAPIKLPRLPPELEESKIEDCLNISDPLSETKTSNSRFIGGENAAQNQLEHFVQFGLATYKSTRNESLGWDYSSKLSPWLAAGCISPRQVYHRIKTYENENGGQTNHTYWVIFELLWRDYMRFFAMKHNAKIFCEKGPARRIPKSVWWEPPDHQHRDAERKFKAWKEGKTGVPWIDGHMRELVKTGFMSNRGRQNVASFLIHNLHVDWRAGANFFQEHLIDHDVTANYGNWLSIAAVADSGARINRFNPIKQARDYDPEGKHARYWIPELRDIPSRINIHSMEDSALKYRPDDYPHRPIASTLTAERHPNQDYPNQRGYAGSRTGRKTQSWNDKAAKQKRRNHRIERATLG